MRIPPLFFIFLAVVATAFNLRPAITGLSAVMSEVIADFHYAPIQAAMLGGMTVFLMGAGSFLAGYVLQRYRLVVVLLGLQVVLAVLLAVRPFSGPWGMFGMTLLVCVVVGLLGAILPVAGRAVPPVARRRLATVLTTALLAGAAIAPVVTVALADTLGGWPFALSLWALPLALAILAWGGLKLDTESLGSLGGRLPVRDRLSWFLTLYMGSQSGIAFIVMIWLAPLLVGQGNSAEYSAGLVSLAIGAQLIGAFLPNVVPAARLGLAGGLMACVSVMSVAILFFTTTVSLHVIAAIALGVAQGATLAIAYSMMAIASRSINAAGLSSMLHGFGLTIAGFAPLAVGFFRGASGAFGSGAMTLLVVALCAAMTLFFGLRAGVSIAKLPLSGDENHAP